MECFLGQSRRVVCRSAPLTRDGSIFAVETPGHMTGHVSIVARSEDLTYVLAGDLTYRQHLLMDRNNHASRRGGATTTLNSGGVSAEVTCSAAT